MKKEYLVIFEQGRDNFAAYSPDLPGCVATGKTKQETLARMREAICLHLTGLDEDGLPIPEPSTTADYVAV